MWNSWLRWLPAGCPLLLDGLSKLEYRGYDSAGVCIQGPERAGEVARAGGRLQILSERRFRRAPVYPGWWALVHPVGYPARHPMKTPSPSVPEWKESPWCTMASLKTIWSSGSG